MFVFFFSDDLDDPRDLHHGFHIVIVIAFVVIVIFLALGTQCENAFLLLFFQKH